jgi:glutamate-1-semialdehyde 2,1-aminomutase
VLDDVVVIRFNDVEHSRGILEQHAQSLAAILVDPLSSRVGMIPPSPAFLSMLREFCDRHGVLLIFDEVIAFRVGPNGAQGRLGGVRPDLTTLGKIIGGGYPSGGFGGRADVMGQFDARRSGALVHGGTFNGNPVSAAAGLATLRHLTPERYAELERLGNRLRTRLAHGITDGGLDARVGGVASIFQVFPGPSLRPAGGLTPQAALFLGLLLDGFHLAPRGMGALSTPVTDADVDELAAAILARLGALAGVASG